MYIRKVKSRSSTCYQLGEKRLGRFVLLQHVGCATDPAQIEAIRVKARQLLYEWKHIGQLSLLKAGSQPPTAKLLDWRITGFHQTFGAVYDRLGFPDTRLRDLVVARIVYPKSKAATLRYLARYLGVEIKKDALYRFLDTLDKDRLTRIAFDFVTRGHPTGITVCFYDVTTLYFETTDEDDLRQKGFSKDHRIDTPQILVGLFVDDRGYPFDFDFFTGKTFEGHTFTTAMEAIRQKYAFPTLTVVADAGMLAQDNLEYLEAVGINYIVGARLKNLQKEVIRKMLKHAFATRPVFKTEVNNQRLLVDYSPDRAKQDVRNRERTVTKLRQKLARGQTVIKTNKYLMARGKRKVTGIHEGRVLYDQQFDGLKGYFTNLKNQTPTAAIIARYHQLWQVEKAFRMSKHDLRERPIYHRQPGRIRAHLTLCFVSLLVMKEAETQLTKVDCSLEQAIELLGKVGRGKVRVGEVELDTESELEPTTRLIHNLLAGH